MMKTKAKITTVRLKPRKDPLTDLAILEAIGRKATRHAQQNAFRHNDTVTIARNGVIYRMDKHRKLEKVSILDNGNFPSLEEDLLS